MKRYIQVALPEEKHRLCKQALARQGQTLQEWGEEQVDTLLSEYVDHFGLPLMEMAYTRYRWVDRARDRHLGGALGEFAKLHIARELGEQDAWSKEVRRLLAPIHIMMDPKQTATKGSFDRRDALAEAIREAGTFHDQITAAKNKMVDYQPTVARRRKKILALDLRSQDLMKLMLREFLPEYADLYNP